MSIRLLLSVPVRFDFSRLPDGKHREFSLETRISAPRSSHVPQNCELKITSYSRFVTGVGHVSENNDIIYACNITSYKIQTYIQTDNNKEIFIYLIFNQIIYQRYSVALYQRHLHSTLLVTTMYNLYKKIYVKHFIPHIFNKIFLLLQHYYIAIIIF